MTNTFLVVGAGSDTGASRTCALVLLLKGGLNLLILESPNPFEMTRVALTRPPLLNRSKERLYLISRSSWSTYLGLNILWLHLHTSGAVLISKLFIVDDISSSLTNQDSTFTHKKPVNSINSINKNKFWTFLLLERWDQKHVQLFLHA